jgi:RNA polymerase sigma factor (sigma-70 family)
MESTFSESVLRPNGLRDTFCTPAHLAAPAPRGVRSSAQSAIHAMPERQELEALFLANLEWIDRVIGSIARRHGLSADERSDFASWVTLRLVENDYAVFQKFRGESSITTYLTTVISMLLRDYRVQQWGRWRASAAALRRGQLATRLEALVYRDGLTVHHAAELLRTSGQTTMSNRQVSELLAQLPRRAPMRPMEVRAASLDAESLIGGAESVIAAEAAAMLRGRAERAIDCALERLPLEDQLIVRMHYWQGLTLAEISRALQLDQRPLYRRLNRLLTDLRRALESAGVSRDLATELLDESPA